MFDPAVCGSDSGVAEDTSILRCYAMKTGKQLPADRRNISQNCNLPVFNTSKHNIGDRQQKNRWRGRVAVRGSEIIISIIITIIIVIIMEFLTSQLWLGKFTYPGMQ